MPYNAPQRGGGQPAKGLSLASNHSIALIVLAALVLLWALRHVFGTVSVSAGTR
jgi:hypothetical protein